MCCTKVHGIKRFAFTLVPAQPLEMPGSSHSSPLPAINQDLGTFAFFLFFSFAVARHQSGAQYVCKTRTHTKHALTRTHTHTCSDAPLWYSHAYTSVVLTRVHSSVVLTRTLCGTHTHTRRHQTQAHALTHLLTHSHACVCMCVCVCDACSQTHTQSVAALLSSLVYDKVK